MQAARTRGGIGASGEAVNTGDVGSPKSTATPAANQADLTEDGLALAFAARVAGRVRYCAATRRWLVHTGTHWSFDTTQATFDECRRLLRGLALGTSYDDRVRLGRASTIKSVLKIARTDRALAITKDQADQLLRGAGR